MSGEIQEIRQTLGRIEGTLNAFLKRQDEHHETLYGNGQPGLKVHVDRLIQTAREQHGRIDVLVNNAGSGYARPTEQAPWEDVQWIMDVNFMGVVRTTKAVLPHMRKARAGHIVNISSVGGLVGQPFNEIYCASKFAIEGYTEAMASYMPSLGINFTAVEPGGIRSEFFNSAMKHMMETGGMPQDPDYYPILQKYLGKARERGTTAYQTPEEVAAVVLKCIESKDPPVRIRTSAWSNDLCHLKTASDPDGKKLQKKVFEMFLGK